LTNPAAGKPAQVIISSRLGPHSTTAHASEYGENPTPRSVISDMPTPDTLYSAFAASDARFDGIYYMGVTSTGIYCRPVCTARTPKAANCRFFESAEQAEKANFRPCLRCRPEL